MSKSKEKFRIWYSDGEMRFGWLHNEGSHGRSGGIAEYDREYAEAQIVLEKRSDPELAFVLIPVDVRPLDDKKEFDRLTDQARQEARAKQRARWSGR